MILHNVKEYNLLKRWWKGQNTYNKILLYLNNVISLSNGM